MNGNGNSVKSLIQTIAVLAAALFLVIRSFIAPTGATTSANEVTRISEIVNINSQRIARLEQLAGSLEDVPQDLARVSAILDRVERKLDSHMGK